MGCRETCCWTRTVADGVAGDRESRRRKKLAVLCLSVVLKSPGTHLASHPTARESPTVQAVVKAQRVRDCRCCGHYQLCWTEPLAVNTLLTKLLPTFAVTSLLPNERAKQWHILCAEDPSSLIQVQLKEISTSHYLLCFYPGSTMYYWPYVTLCCPQVHKFKLSTQLAVLTTLATHVSCFHCPTSHLIPWL